MTLPKLFTNQPQNAARRFFQVLYVESIQRAFLSETNFFTCFGFGVLFAQLGRVLLQGGQCRLHLALISDAVLQLRVQSLQLSTLLLCLCKDQKVADYG